MKLGSSGVLAASLLAAASAFAASPRPLSTDMSFDFLIDSPAAAKIWKENIPARVEKLYPSKKFRFVSQVSGGFTEGKVCVVTARAMLMPIVRLPVQGAKVVYSPIKTATAFDAVPDLDRERCQDLARAKLKEAVQSIASALAET